MQARPLPDDMDVAAMSQLLIRGWHAARSGSYMHPGYLDWAIHNPRNGLSERPTFRIWESGEEGQRTLEAWAIFLRSEGSFDLFVRPTIHGTAAHEAVVDEYLAWADGEAREAGITQLWPFWAMSDDTCLDHMMRERGFVVTHPEPAPPLFQRQLDELPHVPLPEGYVVRTVDDSVDARLRAEVTYAAFPSDADWPTYTDRYAQLLSSAVYHGERDLFVRAPDGRGAAACTIWYDAVNAVGLFEPVATHPDFQRRGLGKR